MPYASPDSMYVMDSSFELLEQTPDVYCASTLSKFNIDHYFDNYDAFYTMHGASPAIENLCLLMHEWIDQQDPLTQAIALSANIYDSGSQLKELISAITNKLVANYLNTNGIEETEDMFGFYSPMTTTVNDEIALAIYNEHDIIFPANIASTIINTPRLFNYVNMYKNRLKKTIELASDLDIQQAHSKMSSILEENNKRVGFTSDFAPLSKHKQAEVQFLAKKAIKKGIKKFTNLFGNHSINSFISGDGFIAEGKKFNWHFQQKHKNSIIEMTHSPLSGHIPYQLSILTKDNLVMADCCVFVTNNTPIIDQLITIMLYIQHDEDELLDNCNMFNKRPAYSDNIHLMPTKFQELEKKCNLLYRVDEQIPLSNYTLEFNRLNEIYLPQVRNVLSSVIGINPSFFNFMLNCKNNPLLTGESSHDFKNMISSKELLLL